MTAQRDLHAPIHDEKLAAMLGGRHRLRFGWYKGMVDASTGRLLYLYDPQNDATISDGELIRDIAAIWDVEGPGAHLSAPAPLIQINEHCGLPGINSSLRKLFTSSAAIERLRS